MSSLCSDLAKNYNIIGVFGFGGLERWNGLDWNGGIHWNGKVEWHALSLKLEFVFDATC